MIEYACKTAFGRDWSSIMFKGWLLWLIPERQQKGISKFNNSGSIHACDWFIGGNSTWARGRDTKQVTVHVL